MGNPKLGSKRSIWVRSFNLLILLLFVRSFWLKSRDFVNNIRIEQFSIVELSKLVYIYLTDETMINDKDFSLAKPHCVSPRQIT